MRIIAVDDERLALENITTLLKKIKPESEIVGFLKPQDAFEYLAGNKADVAFLDIEMGKLNGIALAKKCKDLCPKINIIFVTGYNQYALDALKIHASGYLMKPIRANDIYSELENLRHPLPIQNMQSVRIQTFGNFEIFVDKKPLRFPMAKCKEALAYLVDRKGACITVAELAIVLWEDKPFDKTVQNNTHRVISDMIKALKDADADQIIIKTRKDIAIDTTKVDCDYYRFLTGEVSLINAFRGEYMNNYSWSEFTLASLVQNKTFY